MTWRRYCFLTASVADPRPLIFNPAYPWWLSAEAADGATVTIVAYLPEGEPLERYWDDAQQVDFTKEEAITFSSRFPRPDYYHG